MKLAISSLLACLIAYAIGASITTLHNPEVKFWKSVIDRRDQEIQTARKNQPNTPFIFFTGGSSCAFSIHSAIIEKKTGLPTFNLGIPVSAGGEYIVDQAFRRTNPGDILVIALEPDLLCQGPDLGSPSPFSVNLSSSLDQPDSAAGGIFASNRITTSDRINLQRPGARFCSTYFGKAILGRTYRYSMRDWKYRGRLETNYRQGNLHPANSAGLSKLSPAGARFLEQVEKAAGKSGIRVCYTMPWQLTSNSVINERRKHRQQILNEIQKYIPVIDDGYLGCHDIAEDFADTELHLSNDGSKRRTSALAKPLALWINNQ